MTKLSPRLWIVLASGAVAAACGTAAQAQSGTPAAKPYREEWVFRVAYGHDGEWWKLFQKYQIAILDRERQLGLVTDYQVQKPRLHANNETRWDYRVIVAYPNYDASTHGEDIERELFHGDEAEARGEQRRWELTVNHWDLPIEDIDPHG